MQRFGYLFYLILGSFTPATSLGNELTYPPGELSSFGYVQVSTSVQERKNKIPLNLFSSRSRLGNFDLWSLEPSRLPWPVTFENSTHNMGNNMVQFQQYGADQKPYFHGGCDLRTQAQAAIRAPVAGRIEAGHYGYEVNDDGSMKKFWKPYPEKGNSMYFEVSIVRDDGLRFEFHHVDRATLPKEIIALLDAGGGQVTEGQTIGYVIDWPIAGPDGTLYHHVHYNVITAEGWRVNPEHISVPLPDQDTPEIHRVFGIYPGQKVIEFSTRSAVAPSDLPTEFVVAVTDRNRPNVYVHPPSRVELVSGDGSVTAWDFRESLRTADGHFPDIHSVFKDELRTATGEILRTSGNYTENLFLFRLAVSPAARLPFRIRVADGIGNSQLFELK